MEMQMFSRYARKPSLILNDWDKKRLKYGLSYSIWVTTIYDIIFGNSGNQTEFGLVCLMYDALRFEFSEAYKHNIDSIQWTTMSEYHWKLDFDWYIRTRWDFNSFPCSIKTIFWILEFVWKHFLHSRKIGE